jgi:UDP-N-acetylglucosamine--N-acetylmuramyl-(pentapeptide) pyrophosphoryl-undecaprenol N-acetylglucosamine transferase
LKVLLSGGGTAGHIYPALTVAAALHNEGMDVSFVGTPDGLEARLVPEAGFPFHALPARGIDRSRPWTTFGAVLTTISSTFKARRLLRDGRIDVVVCFGAYVTLPVGLAADLARVPLVIHEQNSVPGLANRVMSYWAERIGVTYPESANYLHGRDRVAITGNPVRPDVLRATRSSGRAALGLREDSTVLLVFGGSRGARHLNEATVSLYPKLMETPGVEVVHVAGREEADGVRSALERVAGESRGRYNVLGYLDDMGSALAAADLVVARAGATSIAEITALGRPSVLVPYPYATDDHQTRNARGVVEAGAAVLVADSDLDGPAYADAVLGLLTDVGRRTSMASAARALGRPDAAARVARLATEAVDGAEPRRSRRKEDR